MVRGPDVMIYPQAHTVTKKGADTSLGVFRADQQPLENIQAKGLSRRDDKEIRSIINWHLKEITEVLKEWMQLLRGERRSIGGRLQVLSQAQAETILTEPTCPGLTESA